VGGSLREWALPMWIPGRESVLPDGSRNCSKADFRCRAKTVCDGAVVSSGGGPLPGSPCASDEECPGPPDARCGAGRCNSGVCEIDLFVGDVIKNQFPGDCKVNVCWADGVVREITDPNDLPLDGNTCTSDTCHSDTPMREALPNGLPCPGKDSGICIVGKCQECAIGFEFTCSTGFKCDVDQCIPMTCADFMQNGNETSVDCGGPDCKPCEAGLACTDDSDCVSDVCLGLVCQESTNTDGKKNDSETGIDCGYPEAPKHMCEDGQGCASSADCKSFVCYLGVCQAPTCTDATQNGAETGTDCGAAPCEPCP
jgi:hypothetical protein